MSQITIKTSSICDKAGRPYNQDNFWLCPDLSQYQTANIILADNIESEINLSEKGALLVVADGMGGMNAGEVASQIIVDSVKQSFMNTESIALDNKNEVIEFIRKVIVDADEKVKQHAADNPETAGMGSTIVLAWVLNNTIYVGWCGDSRAYCYNAKNGLVRLSHDHSYVQGLVDNGTISDNEAFDHPNSNIITRSLGDSGEKAKPEVKDYPIHNGDIYLLCTDGLCGVLRDSEIEEIMSLNHESVNDCLKSLWINGKEVGWTDNVTIEMLKIVDGGQNPENIASGYDKPKSNFISEKKTNIKWITILLSIMTLLVIGLSVFLLVGKKHKKHEQLLIEELREEIRKLELNRDSLYNLLIECEKYKNSVTLSSDEEVTCSEAHEIKSDLNEIDNAAESTESIDNTIQDNILTPITHQSSIID